MKSIKYKGLVSLFLAVFLFAGLKNTSAQQEPAFTQYMFNTQTINPAYAGTWESMGFLVLAREQWLGIDRAPSTQTFSYQTILRNEKIGLGLNMINDRFGFENRLTVNGDYSYKVLFSENLFFRMGLKVGFTNYSNNLSDYSLIDETDPHFLGDVNQKFMPNFGVGGFLYNENFYFGFSMPKLLKNEFDNNYNNYSVSAEMRHLFVMGGYVFTLSDFLKFKPTVLGKYISGSPVQFDFTGNFLIREKVWLGAMYRTGDSFGFIAQLLINNNFRLGYAVDFATTELRRYQNGTHEIMVAYELRFLNKNVISPRYF